MIDRELQQPSGKSRILMVDDHPIVREGMGYFLNLQENLHLCCGVSSAGEALAAAAACRHRLAIVDISLKGESGLDLVKSLRAHHPELAILVLSMHEESIFAFRALQVGANGYLMKQEGTRNILQAINELLAGNIYLSAGMHARLAEGLVGHQHSPRTAISSLSEREFDILHLLGLGLGTRQIAERLCRSVKTVEAHRANIKEKLGLKNGQDLLRFAVQLLDAN